MPTCRPFPFLPPFPVFVIKNHRHAPTQHATRSGEKEPRERKEPQRWTTPGRLCRSLFPSLHIFCAPNSRHRRNAAQRAGWKALKVSMSINIQMSEYLFNVNAPARHVLLFCSKHNNGTCHSLSGSLLTAGSILFSPERFAEHAPFYRAFAHAPVLLNVFFLCRYLS